MTHRLREAWARLGWQAKEQSAERLHDLWDVGMDLERAEIDRVLAGLERMARP